MFKISRIYQNIFRNSFWLILGEVVRKGIMFLVTIMLARYLGREGFGIFNFALAFVALFAFIYDMGLATLIVREIAKNTSKSKSVIDDCIGAKIVLGLITWVLIFIVVRFINVDVVSARSVVIAGIYIVIHSFNELARSIFIGFEKTKFEALARTVNAVLLLIFVIFGVLFHAHILFFMGSYVITSVITLILNIVVVNRWFVKINPFQRILHWRYVLGQTWMFGVISVLTVTFFYIDTVMLAFMDGNSAVGVYNAAYGILYAIVSIPILILNAFYPVFSKIFLNSKDKSKEVFRVSLLINTGLSFVLMLVLIPFAEKIIILMYTREYLASVAVFKILLFALLFASINQVMSYRLYAENLQRVQAGILFMATSINILINWILIPKYSYIGASIATVISEIFVTLGLFFFITFIVERKISNSVEAR